MSCAAAHLAGAQGKHRAVSVWAIAGVAAVLTAGSFFLQLLSAVALESAIAFPDQTRPQLADWYDILTWPIGDMVDRLGLLAIPLNSLLWGGALSAGVALLLSRMRTF
ncbi:MAG TPA: hypothetical protein VGK67_28545 [Myxococcales bacterium]